MKIVLALGVCVLVGSAAAAQSPVPAEPMPLVHPPQTSAQPPGAPSIITYQDALERAKRNDAQFQTSVSEAQIARGDRVQARAGLLPALSATTQYLGNQSNGVNPNGRFVSMDGVHMYRAWGVAHQEVSAATLTLSPLRRAQAAEAAALARVEIAQRGLAVTVTRAYYALAAAQRKYASAQQAAQQSARFLEIARQQEQLGQVARSDVVKADISDRQQQQAYRDAYLAIDAARLALAVLISPTLDEQFSIVDDTRAAPPLPPFEDVRAMAGRDNPDLRAADQSLKAAAADVRIARAAFYPSLVVEGVYGIEANEFALHSRIAAQPELGVLPNLGYMVTANLSVPLWDWGGLRSKLQQSESRRRLAQVTLTQAQRQMLANLYGMYNEAVAALSALENLQGIADLAAESLRLTNLRYQAGESTALEVVDAQTTVIQARNAADDAETRYRVALAQLQTVTGGWQ